MLGHEVVTCARELASNVHHEPRKRLERRFEAVAVGSRGPDVTSEVTGVGLPLRVRGARVVRKWIGVVRAFVRI